MHPELRHYLDMLDYLRGEIATTFAGLDADGLNWRPIDTDIDDHVTNSLAVMAVHVAGAERHWVSEMVGGQPRERQRASEFATVTDQADDLLVALDRTGALTRETLSSLSPAGLDGNREIHDRTFTVRWCIHHAIEHSALHLGHMQLTRQMWDHNLPT